MGELRQRGPSEMLGISGGYNDGNYSGKGYKYGKAK
jgi:hypothetical protein